MEPLRPITDASAREALARVEILYTDLDGTLVAPGGCVLADAHGSPSVETASAIVALNAAGLTVVPISGRERGQLHELARLLGWSGYIAEAGAILVQGMGPDARTLFNNGEWPEELVFPGGFTPYELIDHAGAFDALASAFPGRIEYYDPDRAPRAATHLLRGCVDAPSAQSVLDELDLPVGFLDNGAIRSRGALECGDETPHAYHLVPKGVSKAQAILLDLELRGLEPSQAAAIGDSATDVEMAEAVGVMALVANALDSDGVIAALESKPRDNVWRTERLRGEGWAEFARVWLEASG